MTEKVRRSRKQDLQAFGAGAACGLLAGTFLLSLVIWQFGNVIGSRTAADRYPAHAPDPIARWSDTGVALDDVVTVALERASDESPEPEATSGTVTTADPPAGPLSHAAESLADRELQIPRSEEHT